MAKIGILTFHRSINYGAFMQCYALSDRLKKDFPNDTVEVIDYETETIKKKYSATWLTRLIMKDGLKEKTKFIIKSLLDHGQMKRQKILNSAFGEDYIYLPLSKESLITDDLSDASRFVENNYDLIVVGSDCVWETIGYPFPNLYFINDFSGVKMSYAATMDRLYYPMTSEFKRSYIKEALAKFSYIGVRDVATELFINNYNFPLSHNCDPTFLLDFSSMPKHLTRIKEKFARAGIRADDKIIGIMGGNTMCNMLRKHLGHKYKIVSVYTKCSNADLFLADLTPIEWAQVFSLFSVTVTNYFHGSILSMVNGVPPVGIDLWEKCAPEHISKIEDLYRRTGLISHYFKGSKELFNDGKDVCDLVEKLIENPNRKDIIKAVETEKNSFTSFLAEITKQVELINNKNGQ